MKKFFGILLLTGLVACQPTVPTIITNTNTNSNILNGQGSPIDPTALPTQCLPSEVVPIRVDLTVPLTAPANGNANIDATPKSASGTRSDGCNITQGIFWQASPASVCSVPNPTAFTTSMRCLTVGSCQLVATVPGKGASGTATVACQ